MSNILKITGIQPKVREQFSIRDAAMSGDIVMVIAPTAVAPVPTSDAWTRNVLISIETAAGVVHNWLNGTYATTLSIADDSTAGTASIVSTTLTIVNGQAIVVVSGDAEDWLDTETDTLTIANITVLGETITAGTSVETFTA
jgi:hypothetical protein